MRTSSPLPSGGRVFRAFSAMVPSHPRPAVGYLLAVAGDVVLAAGLFAVRDQSSPLSKGFGLMAVVILAAVVGGLGPGLLAAVMGFLAFNFVFIPPYGSFSIAKAEDVVVLFVFLGLSVLISAVLALEGDRRTAVEAREKELQILNDFTRELVVQVPGPGSYETALGHLIQLFGFNAAALMLPARDGSGNLAEEVAVGAKPCTIDASWNPQDGPAPARIPLTVGQRNLGLVVLEGNRGPLDERENRVLHAFCNELALVLERDRLTEVAETADVYRRTDSVRRSLFGAVSHELRSPLAAIKASVTDLLSPDASTSPEYRQEVLEAVNDETDRLDGLITNLLDMSRIDAGSLVAQLQTSDLTDTLTRCSARVERMWPDHRVLLSIDHRAQLVRADPVFLDRVVNNLLENAAKAAPPGSIEVGVRRDGSLVSVRVADHGPGVPADARERVFHPFFGLDTNNSRLGKGLGLAICRGFLNAMDGEIWIEDTPGGGATFAFSLPAPESR